MLQRAVEVAQGIGHTFLFIIFFRDRLALCLGLFSSCTLRPQLSLLLVLFELRIELLRKVGRANHIGCKSKQVGQTLARPLAVEQDGHACRSGAFGGVQSQGRVSAIEVQEFSKMSLKRSIEEAVAQVLPRLHGAFALAILFVYAMRSGPPVQQSARPTAMTASNTLEK